MNQFDPINQKGEKCCNCSWWEASQESLTETMQRLKAAEKETEKLERRIDCILHENKRLRNEVEELRITKFKRFYDNDCWIYQEDGNNNLESLVCPVVISPECLIEKEKEIERLRALLQFALEGFNSLPRSYGFDITHSNKIKEALNK